MFISLKKNVCKLNNFIATFRSKECLPYLQKSDHAHILNLSPPLNLSPHWFAQHVAYTMAKYGMSMCVLGMAEEFKSKNISVNALWPKTAIHTAAIEMLTGPDSNQFSRKPDIMADAAYEILSKDPRSIKSGQFYIDEDVLRSAGISDMKQYACVPENADNLMPDFFLDALPDDVAKFVPSSTQSSSAGSGKIDGLFSKIEQQLDEDLVKRVNAVYAFNVKGDEAGLWYIDLKNGSGKCGKGESPTPADATLTMDSKNFFAMFSGN